MTDLSHRLTLEAGLQGLVAGALEVLEAAGCEAERRKLAGTPVRPGNRYACLARVTWAVELALRAQHAARLHPAGPLPRAIEAVALVRLGVDCWASAQGQDRPQDLQWVETLRGRQRALLAGLL